MKQTFTFIALLFIFSSFTQPGSIDEIVTALKSGNAAQITKYFDNTVEITLPDKSSSYTKSQGETVLRDFFINSTVKGFDILHKGENSGSQYCIGTLATKNGSYRTTVFMKQKAERQIIQEIRFENK